MADFLIYTMDQARHDAPSHSVTSNAPHLCTMSFSLSSHFFVAVGKTKRISTHFVRIILCKYRLILTFARRATAKSPAICSERDTSEGKRKGMMREKHVHGADEIFFGVNVSARVWWHRTNTKYFIDMSNNNPKIKSGYTNRQKVLD